MPSKTTKARTPVRLGPALPDFLLELDPALPSLWFCDNRITMQLGREGPRRLDYYGPRCGSTGPVTVLADQGNEFLECLRPNVRVGHERYAAEEGRLREYREEIDFHACGKFRFATPLPAGRTGCVVLAVGHTPTETAVRVAGRPQCRPRAHPGGTSAECQSTRFPGANTAGRMARDVLDQPAARARPPDRPHGSVLVNIGRLTMNCQASGRCRQHRRRLRPPCTRRSQHRPGFPGSTPLRCVR